VPLRRPHRGFRPAIVRASPAAIKRSITLPKAGDGTDESLSLAWLGSCRFRLLGHRSFDMAGKVTPGPLCRRDARGQNHPCARSLPSPPELLVVTSGSRATPDRHRLHARRTTPPDLPSHRRPWVHFNETERCPFNSWTSARARS